jgi:hypothetical protein
MKKFDLASLVLEVLNVISLFEAEAVNDPNIRD